MTAEEVYSILLDQFGNQVIVGSQMDAIDPWVEVRAQDIVEVCEFLRDDERLHFDHLNDLCGVDYLETDAKKAKKFDHEPHVEVVYHLSSINLRHRFVVKVKLSRWQNDVEGQLPEVPTVSEVWQIANWHERECFDLVGVHFTGHPNLVRILCPEDWEGHALRKDYDFPLEYHGIRGK